MHTGMFLGGELLLGKSQATTLPLQAVVSRDGFNYVYRLDKDDRVRRVKVKIGRHAGDRVEARAEPPNRLQDADRIVVQGAGFLSEGDRVRIVADSTAHPSSTGDGNPVHSLSH